MKKRFLLLVTLVFLSGCSIQYEMEFNDSKINETIKIGKVPSSIEEEIASYLTPYAISNEERQEFYNYKYSNEYINLNYKYNLNDFEVSNTFNRCYELSNLSYDDNYYYILTSKEFKCLKYMEYEAKEIKINFKSNHKIINSNADYINNNIHTWIINKNNMKNKPIEIKIEKEYKEDNNTKIEEKNNSFLVIILVTIIMIFVLFIILKRKSNKVDAI